MDLLQSIQLVTSEVQNANTFLLLPKNRKVQAEYRQKNNMLLRRKIRNLCFRIKENRIFDTWEIERTPGVHAIMEGQFERIGHYLMTWDNFAAVWDIHPKYPLVVTSKKEWYKVGGRKDKKTGLLVPTAFTAVVQSMPVAMQEQYPPDTFLEEIFTEV